MLYLTFLVLITFGRSIQRPSSGVQFVWKIVSVNSWRVIIGRSVQTKYWAFFLLIQPSRFYIRRQFLKCKDISIYLCLLLKHCRLACWLPCRIKHISYLIIYSFIYQFLTHIEVYLSMCFLVSVQPTSWCDFTWFVSPSIYDLFI